MADFASVFQLANRPTAQLESPMESMAKALQLKAAMQQGELQGLNLQQHRLSMADALAMKQDIAAANGDPEALKGAFLKRGKVKEVADMDKAQKDADKAALDAVKSKHEATTALNGQQLSTLLAARDAIAKAADPAQAQAVWESTRAQLTNNAQPFAKVLGLDLSKTDDPVQFPGLDFLDQKIAQNKTFDQRLKEIEANGFKGFHAGADQTAYQVNAQGQARQIQGPDGKPLRVPPPMSSLIVGQGGGGNLNPTNPLPDMGMEAVAQAIARGDQAPQEYSVRNPAGRVINARAAAIAAERGGTLAGKSQVAARASSLKDFETGGKSGQTISALNTMTEHLATARRMAEALQNGDTQLFNRLRQTFQTQTGQPAPTDFATIKQFLAGEVAKVATGGHITEGEIHAAADRLNQAQSPAQLVGALDTMNEVAGGKLVALDQDYRRLKGKSLAEDGRLTPATRQAFEKANAHINPGSGEAKAPKQLTPAELGKLPPAVATAYLSGKTIQGPDGTYYQKAK